MEDRSWGKGEVYAPVITQTQVCLLVSMSVSNKQVLKQADCCNAFCHGVLPEDEAVIVCLPLAVQSPNQEHTGNLKKLFMIFIAIPSIGSAASQNHSKQ
eukprot:1124558-Ditylum_brightwellii.AAC.1